MTGETTGATWSLNLKARSSGGERYLDTVEVVGSNPIVPTSKFKRLRFMPRPLFLFCYHFATRCFKNGIFQPANYILIYGFHQMRINVQCPSRTRMTKLTLNVFDVFSLLNQKTIIGMSEVVKSDFRDSCGISILP